MEEIFIKIMRLVSERMPELTLIDEDYGQLESALTDDQYPLTFPCVLIGNVEADWNDIGMGAQNGDIAFSVRLAVDCYDDTHLGSGTEELVAGRLAMANRLYAALQDFQPLPDMSGLVRSKMRFYALPHAVKVYEYTFTFSVHDETAMAQ